jgi:hypothetical protein
MLSISQLRKQAESLETDDGIRWGPSAEITIVLDNGHRLDITKDLARKIFGSSENLGKIASLLDGTSLELHDVQVSDGVWVTMDEIFTIVDEV